MKLNIGCAFLGLFAQATVAKLPGFYSPPSQFDAMEISQTNSLSDSPLNATELTDKGIKILSERLQTDAQDLLVKSS